MAFTPHDKNELKTAVNLWCEHRPYAVKIYGHISGWNTSHITDMSELFRGNDEFNDDISK